MTMRRTLLRGCVGIAAFSAVSAVGVLSGCGFQLRQAPTFAFRTLVGPLTDASPLRRELRTALEQAGIKVLLALPPANPNAAVSPAAEVDVVLDVLSDQREKAVVGSTAAGQVREFQLRSRFRFRLRTLQGKDLIEDAEILLQRDISYNEALALSKAEEEAELYRHMQTDIVQQVMRRLAAVRSL